MADWSKITSRGSVEDRRAMRPALVLGGGGLGIGGIALLLLLNYLGGGSPVDVLNQLQDVQVQQVSQEEASAYAGADSYEVFASTVLGSTNDVWSGVFAHNNETYTPPTLILFRAATDSACGGADARVGPHYCPLDQKIYIDETFFDELQSQFGAGAADVAQAYVIAHEVGHHVQNELGILDQIMQQTQSDPSISNELSIKEELQADCLAGLWAYSIKDAGVLSFGEIQEAIDAAAAVGDDRIQEAIQGRVTPETWTHGSSQERVAAFNNGYTSGRLSACDTFAQR